MHKLQYYKLKKFQDFQGPINSNSRTFLIVTLTKHLIMWDQLRFQVLSRPWILRKKSSITFTVMVGQTVMQQMWTNVQVSVNLYMLWWFIIFISRKGDRWLETSSFMIRHSLSRSICSISSWMICLAAAASSISLLNHMTLRYHSHW